MIQLKVFITGASSGIGAELARQYAQQNAVLGLVARRMPILEELRTSLPNSERHLCYPADVTNQAALKTAAQDFINQHGVPDIVIACAGISIGTDSQYEEDIAVIQQVIDTNLLATAKTFQPFINPMKTAKKGTLVGIASCAGIRGLPGAEAYCASKAAVISYCESLRVELHNTGVKVTTILPGYIRTPMTAKNPYGMPFMLDADEFARRAIKAIQAQSSYRVIPWQMGIAAKLLRILPNALYDRLLANRKRKPRKHELESQ